MFAAEKRRFLILEPFFFSAQFLFVYYLFMVFCLSNFGMTQLLLCCYYFVLTILSKDNHYDFINNTFISVRPITRSNAFDFLFCFNDFI